MALPLISAGLRLAGKKILKFAAKQTRKKAYKSMKIPKSQRWDPKTKAGFGSGKKYSAMTRKEKIWTSRWDAKGKPLKGHPYNKYETGPWSANRYKGRLRKDPFA